MARERVDPVTLCREFKIAPVTLRATMTRDANAQGYKQCLEAVNAAGVVARLTVMNIEDAMGKPLLPAGQ